MYMHVCMNIYVVFWMYLYVFMHQCIYLYEYMYIYECMFIYMSINEYICTCIYEYICECMYVSVEAWIHMYICESMHEHMCMFMNEFVYVHICMGTHMCMNSHMCAILYVCTWRESWVIAFWEKGIWRNGVKAGAGYSAKGWDSGDLGTESLFLFPFALRRKLGRVQACLGLLCCLSIWCSRFCRDNILELAVYGGPLKRNMGGWLLSLGLPLSVVTQEVKSEVRQQSQCYRNGPHGLQAFMTLWFKV